MSAGTRCNQGYEIIESCTIALKEIVIGIIQKHLIRMYAGIVRVVTIIIMDVTAIHCRPQGKS